MPAIAVVAAAVVGALVVTRVSGLVMRRVVRRIGESRSRVESADATEQRRRQRTDAAARMLNHLVTLVVWTAVTIVVFHVFDIDAAFFLSGAGFLGAGLAIGGQHKVNDYLTGMSVLVEDRYGVGDELVVEISGRDPIHAVVDNIGLVTTRLRDERSTLHVPNGQLVVVRNLSQESAASTVRLHVSDAPGADVEASAADAVRRLAGGEQLTDVVFVGDLAARRDADGTVDVAVRTTKPLDDRARTVLAERAERALRTAR